jgi:hypothetical protein
VECGPIGPDIYIIPKGGFSTDLIKACKLRRLSEHTAEAKGIRHNDLLAKGEKSKNLSTL